MSITRVTWTDWAGEEPPTTGTTVNNAQLQAIYDSIELTWATSAYTPTWSGTGFALGDGTKSGTKFNIGKLQFFEAVLTVGASTTIGADLSVNFPATAAAALTGDISIQVFDASASGQSSTALKGVISSTTTVILLTSANPAGAVNTTTPITFAVGDVIKVRGWFIAA